MKKDENGEKYHLMVIVPKEGSEEYECYKVPASIVAQEQNRVAPDQWVQSLVEMDVRMAHVPSQPVGEPMYFCGTYLVNLASFYRGPKKDE